MSVPPCRVNTSVFCVLSPYPKFTCEMASPSPENLRTVKGVRLVGTFINVKDYFEGEGFLDLYYETTFDYDYCITSRINGKKIYVANNLIMRSRNFKILTKKILIGNLLVRIVCNSCKFIIMLPSPSKHIV